MKKYLTFFMLCLIFLSNCSKDIEPPFNPFIGTWEDFKIVYHFENEPKTFTDTIEIDYSRPFNPSIENDNGDLEYPCNINLEPIRFTEEKFYRTYNYSSNDVCVTKYVQEIQYDFIKKNDSLYTIHFYQERYYNHEENIDNKYDRPVLGQITEVLVEKNIITFIDELPEQFKINGRNPVLSHYKIKRANVSNSVLLK